VALTVLLAAPSPFWYASRSAGVISLVLLTAVMVLGLAITARLDLTSRWRFVVHGLHRNLSLLTVLFIAIHILAAILDPYARLGWRDALIPFTSTYRPFYLGLGVVAVEILAALVLTGLLRRWIGRPLFRIVHWAAYACWPIALVHGLGTGSDVRQGWFYMLSIACVSAAVAAFLSWRLLRGRPERQGVRTAAGIATLAGVAMLGAWSFTGPLKSGWARAAGTPPQLIHANASPATGSGSVEQLPANLDDALSGTLVRVGAGFQIDLAAIADPTLMLQVAAASDAGGRASITVSRSGKRLCSFTADLANPMAGTCGTTPVEIQVAVSRSGRANGRLTTGAGSSL
jgi:methionine sulfoxide reductase heme-binding subunit